PAPGRELFPLLTPAQAIFTDPVCGMSVEPGRARGSTVYQGHTYYFCCPSCLQRFEQDPERYLRAGPSGHAPAPPTPAPAPAPSRVDCCCPRARDVLSDGRGPRPGWGMALGPRPVPLEGAPNPERADMTRRFAVGLALTLPLLIAMLVPEFPGE